MAADKLKRPLNSISFRLSILIVVLLYFAFGSYWLYVTCKHTPSLILGFPHYSEMLKETWWLITYYSSEICLSVGIVLRWIAGILALYITIIFLKVGENALPKIRGKAGAAIFLEGLYVLTYAPSAFLGFIYHIAVSQGLWYFGERTPPWIIVFLVNGLACAAMVIFIAPPLLKLGLRTSRDGSNKEVIKWGCITGVAYFFAMFWWNYTMAWNATLTYWPERAQPGIEILYKPYNIISFTITVIGLLIISLAGLKTLMPAIKGYPEKVNLKHLGAVMLTLSCYFIIMLILYAVAGGYSAQPTTWMEIIGPHNPDLWCVSFILPGIYLAAKSNK